MRWLPLLMLSACFDWQLAPSICLDAGGACTRPGGGNGGGSAMGGGGGAGGGGAVTAVLTLGDGSSPLDLGDIELGVPQTVLLKNTGPMAVSGLSVSARGSFDAGAQCTTLDVDASCPLLVTGDAVGKPLFTVLTAKFAGGVPSTFAVQANVFGRLVLSTRPDGSGAWELADGGALLSDGGACLDACELRFFTPSVDLRVLPARGCSLRSDGGSDASPAHVTFSSSPQTPTLDAACYDIAFLATMPGGYGVMAPNFDACATAARTAGFPFPDEFEVQLFGLPITGNGWVRTDGVAYAGPSSFAPIFIDSVGAPNDVGLAWFGGPSDDCAGWTNGGTMAGYAVDPADDATDAGGDLLCAVARPVRCFGAHWKNGAPAAPVPPAGARRAFLSSTVFHPGASGLGAADQLCRNDAADAGLPNATQFMAFLSITGREAGARFNGDAGNWYRVDDVPVLFSPGDLASPGLSAVFRVALAKTAQNTVPPPGAVDVWVGDMSLNCLNWTSAASSQTGSNGRFLSAANHALRDPQIYSSTCNQGQRIYCFEN